MFSGWKNNNFIVYLFRKLWMYHFFKVFLLKPFFIFKYKKEKQKEEQTQANTVPPTTPHPHGGGKNGKNK